MNSKPNKAQVEELLDKIRPHFKLDGGDIKIVEITDDSIVKLQWEGSCAKCEKASITLKFSVKEYLMSELPELKDVIEI